MALGLAGRDMLASLPGRLAAFPVDPANRTESSQLEDDAPGARTRRKNPAVASHALPNRGFWEAAPSG
jgi:hypothetical protein